MIRIKALNEESHSSCSEDEEESTVTKEAQVLISFERNCTRALKNCFCFKGNNSSGRICTSIETENR